MDLWIRSQDKLRLVKVNYVYAIENKINSFSIYGETIDSGPIIGTYKTKERALEVLDEIHDILQIKLCSTLGTFEEVFKGYTEEKLKLILKQMAVYEMPKE